MIKVGIVGGAGYTAGELLRVLVNHPDVSVKFVLSKSNTGNKVVQVHKDLIGETDLVFSGDLQQDIDVLFLCMGHGDSKVFLDENPIPKGTKIIDLSQDFRIEGGHQFVYGLPELNRPKIKEAGLIANPGCFATAIQLAILPLAANGLLKSDLHINAITGSTGAGVKPSATSHFSWRNNNVSVYKAFNHQHLKEIRQSFTSLQPGFTSEINFIPVRGNFTRGIMATAYTEFEGTGEQLREIYQEYYDPAAFTHVTDENPDLKQVVNTNKCLVFPEKHGDKAFIVSMIDNLLKGASGQAVQNMNLMFGLPEDTGLRLKPVGF